MIDNHNENIASHFNLILSQQQKLKIIQQLLQQLKPKLPLNVQESIDLIQNSLPQIQSVHYYEVLGNRFKKKTQLSNLVQKIKNISQPILEYQQSLEQQIRQQQGIRYFNCTVRCFRCKKIGHYNNHCPQQYFCIYCLSFKHPVQKCPQKTVCFRCYKFGHVISQCAESEPPFCQVCKRKHRNQCNFLTKGIEQIKQFFNSQYLHNQRDLICMVCNTTGHLNCQQESQNN